MMVRQLYFFIVFLSDVDAAAAPPCYAQRPDAVLRYAYSPLIFADSDDAADADYRLPPSAS